MGVSAARIGSGNRPSTRAAYRSGELRALATKSPPTFAPRHSRSRSRRLCTRSGGSNSTDGRQVISDPHRLATRAAPRDAPCVTTWCHNHAVVRARKHRRHRAQAVFQVELDLPCLVVTTTPAVAHGVTAQQAAHSTARSVQAKPPYAAGLIERSRIVSTTHRASTRRPWRHGLECGACCEQRRAISPLYYTQYTTGLSVWPRATRAQASHAGRQERAVLHPKRHACRQLYTARAFQGHVSVDIAKNGEGTSAQSPLMVGGVPARVLLPIIVLAPRRKSRFGQEQRESGVAHRCTPSTHPRPRSSTALLARTVYELDAVHIDVGERAHTVFGPPAVALCEPG